MALPSSRTEFTKYCLRSLGAGAIKINVTDDQISDRVDEALQFFYDYHFEGADKTYYAHQLTANNVADGYITLPDNIIGAVKVFENGFSSSNVQNPFNLEYQAYFSDLIRNMNTDGLIGFYIGYQHIQFMEQLLVGQVPIRFNRHSHRLYIDSGNSGRLSVGDYVLVEAYQVVDPEVWEDAWKNRLLIKYASALIKLNWGENLAKYSNLQLMGGNTFDATRILTEAKAEIELLEQKIIDSRLPPSDFIG